MAIANLLLVDDEQGFVETMTKRLSKRDFDIITAFSGDEALKQLENNAATEVVILDVKMPGMDGLDTLEEIKKKYPLVEVIMLTGHASVESAVDGLKLGAFDYVMKPCDIPDLLEQIEEAYDKKKAHEEKIRGVKVDEIISHPMAVFNNDPED